MPLQALGSQGHHPSSALVWGGVETGPLTEILSPAHRNQIYSYVGHEAYDQPGQAVEGMLLYALTEGEAAMHESWDEAGHRFHCFTLDLGRDFEEIAAQLDSIAAYAATGVFGG